MPEPPDLPPGRRVPELDEAVGAAGDDLASGERGPTRPSTESSQISRATCTNGSGGLSGAGAGGVVSWGAGDGPFAGAPSRATAIGGPAASAGGPGLASGSGRWRRSSRRGRTTAAAIQTGRRPLSRPAVARGRRHRRDEGPDHRPRRLVQARAAAKGVRHGSDRAQWPPTPTTPAPPGPPSPRPRSSGTHRSRAATSAIDAGRSSGPLGHHRLVEQLRTPGAPPGAAPGAREPAAPGIPPEALPGPSGPSNGSLPRREEKDGQPGL